ncbi:isoleucine--tRNA ligase [Patescibacteria group bacterium]|nr:isoleucine--tRNA ligase [Patescibacteria group bacterium]MBU2579624.1 isoleucine--tRNA ligase [Patescibacteria group bacterium]
MDQIPKMEKRILKFWRQGDVFAKLIAQKKGKRFFSFYDGPPFASGLPHYGHILTSAIKDTVLRYWTMKGRQVPWRVGWDCHGLPVENLIEKELGLKNKREIEGMGIKKFNQACRKSVFRCTSDWQGTLRRVGRWSDYSQAYATLDNEYIESVWWVFKQLWDDGLVYKDYRVTPYCPRCGTPLSNFELNQPDVYQDIEDESVFVKFPLKDEKKTYLLVWTTTPWTLSANMAVAVGVKIKYVKVTLNGEKYILAKERLEVLDAQKYKIKEEFFGKDLVGKEYEPFYLMKTNESAYRVVAGDFVSVDDGTGMVHIAPAFGEDDAALGKKEKLPTIVTVDEEGKIIRDLGIPGEGKFIKKANQDIKDDLRKRGLLFKAEKIVHSYPHCWRCNSPLIYHSIDSWYVAVTKFKKELVANNKKTRWVPGHLKEGRFGNWIKDARDWSISRNRFWGAPLPIWQCKKCGEQKCVGSVKELEKLSGKKTDDLHRPIIDAIFIKCQKCGGRMERTPEVFDCWFESGSMPYAQWHYPFENKKLVEETFPADFIAEGMDQTRGWFYSLLVLATALTLKDRGLGKDKPAFRNVVVNGLVLGEDGTKLSKKLGNYAAPEIIFNKYGADALRYFLLSSTPIGEDYIFSEQRVAEIFRRTILTFWNSLIFFKTYTAKNFKAPKSVKPKNVLDRWIVSRLNSVVLEMTEWMDQYELTKASRLIDEFLDDFSNWFVRRSRRRLQKPSNAQEKKEAEETYSFVLLTFAKLSAPFTPFIAEEVYQKLNGKQSVHFDDYPKVNKKLIDKKLEEKMSQVRQIAAAALAQRAAAGIKVRQPLGELAINNEQMAKDVEMIDLIKDEINVKKVILGKEIKIDTKITAELRAEGIIRDLIRFIQGMRKDGGLKPGQRIYLRYTADASLSKLIQKHASEIKEETSAEKIELAQKRKEVFLVEKETIINGEKIWLGIKKLKFGFGKAEWGNYLNN